MISLLEKKDLIKKSPKFFALVMFIFCFVIILHIISLRVARDGCDYLLEESTEGKGIKYSFSAKKIDTFRDFLFFLNIIFVFALFIKCIISIG